MAGCAKAVETKLNDNASKAKRHLGLNSDSKIQLIFHDGILQDFPHLSRDCEIPALLVKVDLLINVDQGVRSTPLNRGSGVARAARSCTPNCCYGTGGLAPIREFVVLVYLFWTFAGVPERETEIVRIRGRMPLVQLAHLGNAE